jgi:hypothetical protein
MERRSRTHGRDPPSCTVPSGSPLLRHGQSAPNNRWESDWGSLCAQRMKASSDARDGHSGIETWRTARSTRLFVKRGVLVGVGWLDLEPSRQQRFANTHAERFWPLESNGNQVLPAGADTPQCSRVHLGRDIVNICQLRSSAVVVSSTARSRVESAALSATFGSVPPPISRHLQSGSRAVSGDVSESAEAAFGGSEYGSTSARAVQRAAGRPKWKPCAKSTPKSWRSFKVSPSSTPSPIV